MAYTITEFGTLKTRLAELLGDNAKVFWTEAELGTYLHEALTVFQALAHYWRETGSYTPTPGQRWQALSSVVRNPGGDYLLQSQVTDRELLEQVLYTLLEDLPVTWASWGLTEQFNQAEIEAAFHRAVAAFQAEANTRLVRTLIPLSPIVGTYELNERVVGIQSLAVITPEGNRYPLWKEPRRTYQLHRQSFLPEEVGFPRSYTWLEDNAGLLRLHPLPADTGTLEALLVELTPPSTPTSSATALTLPPNLWWVIKYGVLADLLSRDGEGQDWARAEYCRQRWEDGIQLAKLEMPSVTRVWLNTLEIEITSLQALESWRPAWGNETGTPRQLILAGWEIAAFYPAIASTDTEPYTAEMQLVQRINLPASDSEIVTIGEEYLTAILAYARHIALLKTSGAEFQQSLPAYQELFDAAANYNDRLRKHQRAFSFYRTQATKDRNTELLTKPQEQ